MKLNLLSYNILAPCHVTPERYPKHRPSDLSWDQRKHLLIERIEQADADIFCLQEIEHKGMTFLDAHFSIQGYRSIFAIKGFSKCEGLACFFRFEHLLFYGAETLFFRDHFLDRHTGYPFASGDIALFLYFKTNKGYLGIVTTHLHAYLPESREKKAANREQWTQLFTEFVPQRKHVDHWVIMGDFNTSHHQIPQHLLEKNGLVDLHHQDVFPTFEDKKIDYIFHSQKLKGTPVFLPHAYVSGPNAHEGSDHIPILGRIDLSPELDASKIS